MGELLRLAESDFSKVFQDMENVANTTKKLGSFLGKFFGKCIWVNHLTFWVSGQVLLFLFEFFCLCIYIPGDQGDCFLGRYSRLWGDVNNNNIQVINIQNKMSLDDVCCVFDKLSSKAVNEVYKEFFTEDFPARAAMQVFVWAMIISLWLFLTSLMIATIL